MFKRNKWKIFQNFPQFVVDFRRILEKKGKFSEKIGSYQQKNGQKAVMLSTGEC